MKKKKSKHIPKPQVTATSPSFKKGNSTFPYELTIGMIVKNDRDNLQKCLETMQPLRDAISCQLIISDTGSTDGTREVAEKFADLLLDFQWIDDFAAARNQGIEHAEGRWFMYVDSDHEFDESILQIARFLQNRNNDIHDAATVDILNYLGVHSKTSRYRVEHKPLLTNFSTGKRFFKYAIHEAMDYDTSRITSVKCNVHHWGYLDEMQSNKHNRNIPLLQKSIEKEPWDLKNHLQLMRETTDWQVRKERSLAALEEGEKALASTNPVMSNNIQKTRLLLIQLDLYTTSYNLSDWNLFDDIGGKILKQIQGKYANTIISLEYYGVTTNRLAHFPASFELISMLNKTKQAHLKEATHPDKDYGMLSVYRYKEAYALHSLELTVLTKLVGELKQKEASSTDSSPDNNSTLSATKDNKPTAITSEEDVARLRKEVVALIENSVAYQYKNSEEKFEFVTNHLTFLSELKLYHLLPDCYRFYQKNASEKELRDIRKHFESIYLYGDKETRDTITQLFSKERLDGYTALYQLRQGNFSQDAFTTDVLNFFEKEPNVANNVLFSDLLYAYLATGHDTLEYVKKSTFSFLLQRCHLFFKHTDAFGELLKQKLTSTQTPSYGSLREEKMWAYFCHQYLLYLSKSEENYETIQTIFPQFVTLMMNYTKKVYTPIALSSESSDVLSSEESFASMGEKALAVKDRDLVEYLKILKNSLKFAPDCSTLVQALSENITVAESKNNELTALAAQVKENIRLFIQSGDLNSARLFFEQYKAIQPTDPDIPSIATQLQ